MKLSTNQLCPIHRRTDCCGRKTRTERRTRKYLMLEPGVRRIPDPHHPRGYRELRSPSAMRRLVNQKVGEQQNVCPLCGKEFSDMREVGPDHVLPRGMNAGKRDDHPDNIQATHNLCNLAKGSKRL